MTETLKDEIIERIEKQRPKGSSPEAQAIGAALDVAINIIEDALLAQPPAQGGWQPIETAPKGTALLLSDGYAIYYGYYSIIGRRWEGTKPDDFTYSGPTHWMPLPALPTQDKETR